MRDQLSLFPLEEYVKEPVFEEQVGGILEHNLGPDNAAAVVKALGGLSVKIPSNPKGTDYVFFEQKLGSELAQLLIDKFAGEEIYISRNHSEEVWSQHQQVIKTFRGFVANGNSRRRAVHQTALQLQRSGRHIYRILDQYKI